MQTGKLPPAILNKLLARARINADVLVGPAYGEDAAAMKFGERVLVAASDPVTFTTDRIGSYVVGVNANDIAVMGAVPRWFLATILLPAGSTEEEVESVFGEIAQACENLGVSLVGGHTEVTDSVNQVIVSGCMLGEADEGSLIKTGGARPGDSIILAGECAIEGTAILAREAVAELLANGISEALISTAAGFLDSFGICIVNYAKAAVEVGGITAMHDPTEGGVVTALREMAAASGCGLRIDREAISILPECAEFCRVLAIDPLGLIASGCLLIAVSPENTNAILLRLRNMDVPVRHIGEMVDANRGLKFTDGSDLPVFARDEIARFFDERE